MKRNGFYLTGIVLLGCSGETMVVGDGDPARAGSASSNTATTPVVSPSECSTLSALEAEMKASYGVPSPGQQHVGRWRGFVSIPASYLPSDEVVLEVRSDGTGTMVFGQGEPPPAPMSPTDTSLCGAEAPPSSAFLCGADQRLFAGMAYPLMGIRSDGVRLRATLPTREPWNAWCALQTPVRVPDGNLLRLRNGSSVACEYGLGPDFRGSMVDVDGCYLIDPREPIDCTYLSMVYSVQCTCRIDGCLYQGFPRALDVALFDDNEGLIGVWDNRNIQFRRE